MLAMSLFLGEEKHHIPLFIDGKRTI